MKTISFREILLSASSKPITVIHVAVVTNIGIEANASEMAAISLLQYYTMLTGVNL